MLGHNKKGVKQRYLQLSPLWRWFWVPLILLFLFSVSIIFVWSQNEYSNLMLHITEDEQRQVDIYISKISDSVDHIFFDLEWLSQQNELRIWLASGSQHHLEELAKEYLVLIGVRPFYSQIRLLDTTGQEVFRVEQNGQDSFVTPREKLQNKSDRYYFKESFQLPRGTVYVSPMDLNVENGKTEIPFKPMLRFITPTYDANGQWRGSLIINYRAAGITDVLRKLAQKVIGSLMLLNRSGFWLVAENPADEWGFQVPERQERLFYKDYPESWVQMQSAPSGQFLNSEGLFTYAKIDMNSIYQSSYQKTSSSPGGPINVVTQTADWRIISHISPLLLEQRFAFQKKAKWLFLGLALIASLIIASLFYRNRNKQQLHQDELEQMAFFDVLTGLTSRALFVDQLKELLHLSRREGDRFALMVVDLDGFKQINDTFGHEGGDTLLCLVAERLRQNVRSTDTVARTGGDEFSIILSRVEHTNVAQQLAQKILGSLQQPFEIKGRRCHIGASIGYSVSNELEQDADVLWKQADMAMYRAKQGGKNQIYDFTAI